jgi:hypothetical protein
MALGGHKIKSHRGFHVLRNSPLILKIIRQQRVIPPLGFGLILDLSFKLKDNQIFEQSIHHHRFCNCDYINNIFTIH